MIDTSSKFNTLRYARAIGRIRAPSSVVEMARSGRVPKGDVIATARCAGIAAAKRTSELVVFCHPVPLDWIEVEVTAAGESIDVEASVRAVWRTGVEMEALAAVSGALLNIYDMLKPLGDDLVIEEIRLVEKTGGKGDFTDEFPERLRAAVLVISDSAFAGKREDKSGKVIMEHLEKQPVEVVAYEVLPDDGERIESKLVELADVEKVDLVLTTGGTGLGPEDLTPEATGGVIDREAPGIAEAIRHHGKERTPYAMLSRGVCGVRGRTLIVNLPGSSRGAEESMEALFPGLLHAFPMLRGAGHEGEEPGRNRDREKGKR